MTDKKFIIPTTIFSIAIVIASWTYLKWIAPVALIILLSVVLFAVVFLFTVMVMAYRERWGQHRTIMATHRADASQEAFRYSFYNHLSDRVEEVTDTMIDQARNGLTYIGNLINFKAKPLPSSTIKEVSMEPSQYLESPPQPLLDAIGHLPRIVVVGGMGSGKTNTILHLARLKTKEAEVYVFDSHSSPKKWPRGTNVSVKGTGRNYEEISESFEFLLTLMDERYQEIGEGIVEECTHPPIMLVADEWTLLPSLVPDMQESARSLFTEGRKANIGFVIAVHDLTVGALGLKGFSNLRESFDCIVFCDRDAKTGQYKADIQWGWGNRVREPMVPPPKYQPQVIETAVENEEDPFIIDLGEESVKGLPSIPTSDSIVMDTYYRMVNSEETFSWNQLCIRLYGKKGGTYNTKIREVLDRYGIDYEKYL